MNKEYLIFDEIALSNFTSEEINKYYSEGYIFGRRFKGDMYQTRSLRINLSEFETNSENRRILRKNESISLDIKQLPLENYSWEIHKMGKEFYESKFGKGIMSASKIKSMFNDIKDNNQSHVLVYTDENQSIIGYCLSYLNSEILHYSYPFYKTELINNTIGISMMTKAIIWAKNENRNFVYLGSVADKKARYKLQFKGLEWWDYKNSQWSKDIKKLKELIQD